MVDVGRAGQVTFTFRCNTPRQVYLVGDFNDWDSAATPMQRGDDGLWYVTIKLKAGRYEFRYYEDGGQWHTDFAASGVVPNDFGGFNSVVEVLPTPRMRVLPDCYPFSGHRLLN